MLGRHNITIYADEAQRCIGGIRQLMATHDMGDLEQGYWLGAIMTLDRLLCVDMPDNYQAFIAALQLHFTGEMPGEIVELEEGN